MVESNNNRHDQSAQVEVEMSDLTMNQKENVLQNQLNTPDLSNQNSVKSNGSSDTSELLQRAQQNLLESQNNIAAEIKRKTEVTSAQSGLLNLMKKTSDFSEDEINKQFEQCEDGTLTTEAYYCTPVGQIKGKLKVSKSSICFYPVKCVQNKNHQHELNKFDLFIDIADIVRSQSFRTESNDCMDRNPDMNEKRYYMYDYYIQINIATINGQSRPSNGNLEDCSSNEILESTNSSEDMSPDQKKEKRIIYEHQTRRKPYGTVFFRFSHKDNSGKVLKNTEQRYVVKNLCNRIIKLIEDVKPKIATPELKEQQAKKSSTLITYYDLYNQFHEKESGEHTNENAENNQIQIIAEDKQEGLQQISKCLPKFKPIRQGESEILSNGKMNVLTSYLPLNVRMREWHLLFSINRDGHSPITFYKMLKDRDNTLLIIKDQNGEIFGAYCTVHWHWSRRFYGTGESFVFTFHDDDDMQIFRAVPGMHQYQSSDDDGLIIGGSSSGKSSIVLQNSFKQGHSSQSDTYKNEILCTDKESHHGRADFKVLNMEIWGFDFA